MAVCIDGKQTELSLLGPTHIYMLLIICFIAVCKHNVDIQIHPPVLMCG